MSATQQRTRLVALLFTLLLVSSPAAAATSLSAGHQSADGAGGVASAGGAAGATTVESSVDSPPDKTGAVQTESADGGENETATDDGGGDATGLENGTSESGTATTDDDSATDTAGTDGLTATGETSATLQSTNNTSTVRADSDAVVANLTSSYDQLYNKKLNATWWEDRGETYAKDAFADLNPLNSLEQKALEKAALALGGSVVAPALAVYSYAELATTAVKFLEAIRSSALGNTMGRAEHYTELRSNLASLERNAESIEQAEDTSTKQDLYERRRTLLKETYRLLPTYLSSSYREVRGNPLYFVSPLPGTGVNLGRTTYSGIRGNLGQLRLVLVVDYYATTSWLSDNRETTHIAREAATNSENVAMPTHNLYYSQKTARVYDTLDVPEEYTIYRIGVSEAEAEGAEKLRVRVRGGDMENFSAYFAGSDFSNVATPDGRAFDTAYGDKKFVKYDVEAGNYYVLVKSENKSLPYRVTASVVKSDPLPLIDWNRTAPTLRVDEKGFSAVRDEDIPDEPAPEITSTCVVPNDGGFSVDVAATNQGKPSDWQSIAVGVPGVNNSSITLRSHELDYAQKYEAGTPLGAAYGTDERTLSYPLVEGATTDWENQERSLRLQVDPDGEGTYTIYVKSVAKSEGVWRAAPAIGGTNTTDGQDEFVYTQTVTVNGAATEASTAWSTTQGDGAHTGVAVGSGGVTHDVTEQWRAETSRLAGTPVVVGDSVFVTTQSGTVYALNRSAGTVRWSYDTGQTLRDGPTYKDGVLYVSTDSKVLQLNARTGSVSCSFQTGDKRTSTPVVRNDTIFVTTRIGDRYGDDGAVYAVDRLSGTVMWRNKYGDEVVSAPPAVAGNTVYVATRNGRVLALDRLTGSQRWARNVAGTFSGAPTVADGTVYVGDHNGRVTAMDAETGAVEWRHRVGGTITRSLAVAGDSVFAVSGERLFSVTQAGEWQWSYRADAPLTTAPTVTNRTVYVASREAQRVYGVDRSDGTQRWEQYTLPPRTGIAVDGSDAVVGAGSFVESYSGETDGPTARIGYGVTNGETVAFDGSGSAVANGTIQRYEWDLDGDGEYERTGASPTRDYVETGEHLVRLRVVGPDNATDTTADRLSIGTSSAGETWTYRDADRQRTGAVPARGPTHDLNVTTRVSLGRDTRRTPMVHGNRLYVATRGNRVVAVDPTDNETRWATELGGEPTAPTVSDGVAYVSASDNVVYALDTTTGEQVWSFTTGDKRITQATIDGDTVYVGTRIGDRYGDDGAVYAIDADTGQQQWRNRFGDDPVDAPPTVGTTYLYVATRSGKVRALDARSGGQQWAQNVDNGFTGSATLVDGTLYLGGRSGTVQALDAETGARLWSHNLGVGVSESPAVTDGTVFAAADDRVYALDAADGAWRWSHAVDNAVSTAPAVAGTTVYVGSAAHDEVYALDTSDGSERWSRHVADLTTGLAVVDGAVTYGTGDGVATLSGQTGAPTARFDITRTATETAFSAAGATDPDGDVTTYEWDLDGDGRYETTGETVTHEFATPGTHLVTLRVTDDTGVSDTVDHDVTVDAAATDVWQPAGGDLEQTGAVSMPGLSHNVTKRWVAEFDGKATTAPTVSNGTAYVGTTGDRVEALDVRTGTTRWRVSLGGDAKAPTVDGGTAYVSASNNVVYALNLTTGERQWQFNTGDKRITQAVVVGDTVYVGTRIGDRYGDDGAVYAIDADTGKQEWRNRFGDDPVDLTPTVAGTTVYVATNAGKLRALDRETGSQLWAKNLDGTMATPPTLVGDTVYAGSRSGTVYAVDAVSSAVQWQYHTGARIRTSLAVREGTVYAASGDRLHALSAASGRWQWSFDAGETISESPTVAGDIAYVVSAGDRRLHGVDVDDGTERWSRIYTDPQTAVVPLTDAALAAFGNDLYRFSGDTGGPTARIDVDTVSDQTVTYAATDSVDPAGTALTYEWDVDGDGSYEQMGEELTRQYASSGYHWVTLRVTDTSGATDTTRRRVAVGSTTDWETRHGDIDLQGDTPAAGPTHDVDAEWRYPMSSPVTGTPSVVGDTVLLGSNDGQVYAVDGANATTRWASEVGAPALSPMTDGQTAYVSASNNVVYALNLTTGERRWQFNTGDKRITQAVVVGDTVYVGTRIGDRYGDDGAVYAIDADTGKQEWRNRFGDDPVDAQLAVGETLLYVTTNNGRVRALDQLTGSQQWSIGVTGRFSTAPALDGDTLYAGGHHGTLFELDTESATITDSVELGGRLSSPTVTDDRVYVTNGSHLFALNRTTLAVEWRFESDYGDLRRAPSATDDTVYVTSADGQRVYGVDVLGGSLRWVHHTFRTQSGVAVVDGAAYVGAGSSLYRLDGDTGAPSVTFRLNRTPEMGEPIRLDASRSTGHGSSITSYEWDLDGDGSYEATGPQLNHTFDEPGDQTVVLRVTDSSGTSLTESRSVRVADTVDPDPALEASRIVVEAGETVSFDATDSTDNLGIERYAWAFEDGTYTEGTATASHTFDAPGEYNVSVRVTDVDGNTATEWALVSVVASFQENLSATRTIHGNPRPGSTTNVTVRLTANESVSGPTLIESLPDDVTLVAQSSPSTVEFKPATTTWLWQDVAAGESRVLNYTVTVPADASVTDRFVFNGSASGYAQTPVAVGGDQRLSLSTCVERAVAGSDLRVSRTEAQRALHWWSTDEPVPSTNGETLTMRETQRLVHDWATNATVSCEYSAGSTDTATTVGTDSLASSVEPSLATEGDGSIEPGLATEGDVSVDVTGVPTRQVTAGENVTFTTTVDAGDASAPGVALSLPDGWTVVSTTQRGGFAANSSPAWLWLTGDTRTVTYTVHVPETESGTAQLGATGSAIDTSGTYRTATDGVTVTVNPRPASVGDTDARPTDPDDDGAFEDVNGDGSVDILDVQRLFVSYENDSVQQYPSAFDYNGNGQAGIVDIQRLFVDVTDRIR